MFYRMPQGQFGDLFFENCMSVMWELDINGRGRRQVGKNWAIMPGDGPIMPGDDQ